MTLFFSFYLAKEFPKLELARQSHLKLQQDLDALLNVINDQLKQHVKNIVDNIR